MKSYLHSMATFCGAAAICLTLTSCAFFSSKEVTTDRASTQATRDYFRGMVFSDNGLAFETENFLRGNLMLDNFDEDPVGALKKIAKYYEISGDPEYLEIAADLCRWIAARVEPEKAVRYHLTALYYCRTATRERVKQARASKTSSAQSVYSYRMLLVYNESCYGLYSYLHQRGLFDHDSFALTDVEGRKYTFLPNQYNLSVPRKFVSDFLPCADFKINDLFQKTTRLGTGLPLIGIIAPTQIYQSLRTPDGLTIPVTMLAFISERPDHTFEVQMQFQDTSVKESLYWGNEVIQKADWPLALDFSTPLAYFLGQQKEQNLISFMVNSDDAEKESGLFMLEPYQPNKIPVVFVHGLMSSPNTWSQMMNSLKNDPLIRQRYQFWFYFYSSGIPVPISSKRLLDALYATQKEFCTTEEATKNFNQMVIVGHSMGGLLTRMLIQKKEHAFIEVRTNQSWENLLNGLSQEEKDYLAKNFSFPALPFVHRVIFMAVPHRGSEMAKMGIARFGTLITDLPSKLVGEVKAVSSLLNNKKHMSIAVEKHTGLENLDPDSDFMQTLQKIEIKEGVTFHSIIGDKNGDNRLGGTDGVVPYWSSHRDGAASEMVVQSGHSVHRVPAAIREVMRILRLHLKDATAK